MNYRVVLTLNKVRNIHEEIFKKGFRANSSVIQLIEYFCVGALSALVEWTTFSVFLLCGIYYLWGVFFSFILATGTNYWLCRRFVFLSRRHGVPKEATLLYLVSAAGLILNIVLMWVMVDVKDMPPIMSKILASTMVFGWNFISRKLWVFGN